MTYFVDFLAFVHYHNAFGKEKKKQDAEFQLYFNRFKKHGIYNLERQPFY